MYCAINFLLCLKKKRDRKWVLRVSIDSLSLISFLFSSIFSLNVSIAFFLVHLQTCTLLVSPRLSSHTPIPLSIFESLHATLPLLYIAHLLWEKYYATRCLTVMSSRKYSPHFKADSTTYSEYKKIFISLLRKRK